MDGTETTLIVAAAASVVAWLAAAGVVYVARRPPRPGLGPRTLDLGPEPPAVANFLVNGFRVTDEAVSATLLDLAARNVVDVEQRGPEVFYVRLRPTSREDLTAYELRVLAHLEQQARDGVVPARALTTGPEGESTKWWRGFRNEVVADAKARGLSRDALDSSLFTALTAAVAVPAILVWAAWEFEAAVAVGVGAVALLGWIRARHSQRETSAGMDAASRWLGVRAELATNEVFPTHSPLTVELWSRLLAYGAALGVASAASGSLPLGVESDKRAWSSYGGTWREVEIAYPRFWPPGWGSEPLAAVAVGLALVAGGAFVLYTAGPSFFDAGVFGVLPLAVVGFAVILGVAVVVMGASDWRTAAEVTGPILRLRAFDDDKRHRYYLAVDDGSSRETRAFKVSASQYDGLDQGDFVTVRTTANLGRVRWIVPADASAGEPA